QVMERLSTTPGVEKVSMTVWPLMSGESAVTLISLNGGPPGEVQSDVLNISPGWMDTMRIPFLDGRDFTAADNGPAGAVVNRAFAKQFFDGEDPVGKWFESNRGRSQIVGLVPDVRSRDNMRIPIRPIAYLPLQGIDAKGAVQAIGRATFVVRTSSANPM